MVRRENSLDDVILQIFEDQEDVFHFPVTTQREARAFVKALHLKGVAYEALYTAVEEFEPNFTSWRKGLGKPGIGNRVIERINQPLQEILLSDAEEENEEEEELKSNVKVKKATFESAKTVTESPNVRKSDISDKQAKLNSVSSRASSEAKGLENALSHRSNQGKNLDTNQTNAALGNGVKSDKLKPENNINDNDLSKEIVKPTEAPMNNDIKQRVIPNDEKLKDKKHCETENVQQLNTESKVASKVTAKVDTKLNVKNEEHNKTEKLKVDSSIASTSPTPCVQEKSLDVHQAPVALLQVKSACNSESDESFVSVGSDIDRAVSPHESAAVFPDEKVVSAQPNSNIASNNQVLVDNAIPTQMPVQPVMPASATVVAKRKESPVRNDIINDVSQVRPNVSASKSTNKESIPTLQPNVKKNESINNKTDINSQQSVVGITKINEQTVNKNDETAKTVVSTKDQKIVANVLEGEKKVSSELTKNPSTNEENHVERTNSTTHANTNKTSVNETSKAKSVEANKEVMNKDKKVDDQISVTKVTAKETVSQESKNVSNNPLLAEQSPKRKISSQNDTAEKYKMTVLNKETIADVNQNVVIQNKTLAKNTEAATQDILTKSDPLPNKITESTLGPEKKSQQAEVSVTQNKQSAVNKGPDQVIKKSSVEEISASKERGVNQGQDNTADDFVILDSSVSPTDELTSGSWVLEPKPSELVIEAAVEDEISECYDSDMDLENLDCLPAVRNQLRLLKSTSRLCNVDGTGYIYAFTDSSNDAKNHRIKVGASRQPYKKLQQATLFNVDVKLVSAVRVGSTKSALLDILGQLERYLIVDAKYWFLGPLDDILQILMETCMNYPVQQSPSMPSSPSAVGK